VVVQRQRRAGREAEDADLKKAGNTPGRGRDDRQYVFSTTDRELKKARSALLAYREIVALVYVHVGDLRERRRRQEAAAALGAQLVVGRGRRRGRRVLPVVDTDVGCLHAI